ncbi:MAG: hypothetical protein QHC90_25930 [Shinella sp.]|nr:hypothetical protein [Shinella sp.]
MCREHVVFKLKTPKTKFGLLVLQRVGPLVFESTEAVDKLGQTIGRRHNRALESCADGLADQVETTIEIFRLPDQVLVHNDTEIVRRLDLVADRLLPLTDDLQELLATRPAEHLVEDADLRGLIHPLQFADDFGEERRRVFKFPFQFIGGIAETLERFRRRTASRHDEFVGAEAKLFQTVRQSIDVDPVLLGDELQLLKRPDINTGTASGVPDLRNSTRGIARSADGSCQSEGAGKASGPARQPSQAHKGCGDIGGARARHRSHPRQSAFKPAWIAADCDWNIGPGHRLTLAMKFH